MNYYNEFEPKAAAALRQLITDGLIPQGEVDDRSIADIKPDELRGYTQCHFFAGIGGWSYALQLAGWPSTRPVWTGSCPCQPFSSAGKQKGTADERHLWPVWFNLIRECRPSVVFGEQVSQAVSHGWLDGVCADMEAEGYALGSAVLPACSVNAPHKRDRLWFVANAEGGRVYGKSGERQEQRGEAEQERREFGGGGEVRPMGNTNSQPGQRGAGSVFGKETEISGEGTQHGDLSERPSDAGEGGSVGHAYHAGPQGRIIYAECGNERAAWSSGVEWIGCADGKARRVKSGIRLLVDGFPERVGLLRAGGNAIVPEVAARFIEAFMLT